MATNRDTHHEVEQWWDALILDDSHSPNAPTTMTPTVVGGRGDASARAGIDELADRRLVDPAAEAPRRARPVSRRRALLGAVGAVGLGVAVMLAVSISDTAEPRTDAAEVSLAPATPAPAAAPHCPDRIDGDTVLGAGRGGTDRAPEAILGFEHAYYIERNGTAARAFTTPDAAVPAAGVIQAGIDSVPQGTTHCVRITALGPDTWAVDLSEHRPGERAQLYLQTVTTTNRDGQILITRISQR
ncbi:hypothetical protein [Nocardia carnea]|uniref:hypothetical protein n=1 Tax=Nocardia carnea TaxID=37328 RepID=UPI0012DD5B1A|nr:hypothetical protein [Nocardia carnea]